MTKHPDIDQQYAQSADIQTALQKLHTYATKPGRILIGLTGGPGSGKSTLANYLQTQLKKHYGDLILSLPMDGFHLTKAQLSTFPDPKTAFARRGAPWTFDSAEFVKRVHDIKHSYQKHNVLWPSFDHTVGDPIENDITIPKHTKIILIEGLYLLHNADGWEKSKPLFTTHWYLNIPLETSRERLINRHIQAWGIGRNTAIQRIESSDALNAALVDSTKHRADWLLG